jgi:hypothetical protein
VSAAAAAPRPLPRMIATLGLWAHLPEMNVQASVIVSN